MQSLSGGQRKFSRARRPSARASGWHCRRRLAYPHVPEGRSVFQASLTLWVSTDQPFIFHIRPCPCVAVALPGELRGSPRHLPSLGKASWYAKSGSGPSDSRRRALLGAMVDVSGIIC
ncbi:hypothetical protein DFP72DRAFT_1176179 [Ephemerocybe angulata]|uniref:Uncharacterized protein n=1 Tax=Ephemerocybe angulata TaxID=980116 RepID=A0A8H6HG67_9AGAR|nr:hypothetical protein DFP72DRAFT_1176179 [Tulosesus angulatus]